jgi:quercetin dioxygenase-like cupin family protein
MKSAKSPKDLPPLSDTHGADDALQLCRAVAGRLKSMQPAPGRSDQLRTRLLHRVHSSALAHREYTTIRVEDGAWVPAAEGVARRVLRSDAGACVELQRLSAGATLPWPDDAQAQEILLLAGALAAADGAPSPMGVPGAAGYCVRQRTASHEFLVAAADSTVYVRHLLSDRSTLPALEARWWELACASSAWVDPGRRRWHASAEGVDVLPLRGDADVVSMLVRFAPGAAVADHTHALDEDCLVLQGEMFLGDILLRAGDYQLAPAGGTHFGETSDVGVLFFFHGALDPVLRGASTTER